MTNSTTPEADELTITGLDGVERLVDDHMAMMQRPPPISTYEDDGDNLGLLLLPRTDLGNAQRFAARWKHEVRHVAKWKKWLVWSTEGRWVLDERNTALNLARATAQRIWWEADRGANTASPDVTTEDVQKHTKWWMTSQSAPRINAMLHLASASPGLVLVADDLDQHPWCLHTFGGRMVNLETGNTRRSRRTEYLTSMTPMSWRAVEEPAPKWHRFLERVLPDPEVHAFVQRFFGYAITGAPVEHAAVFFHGEGANGKTQLVEAVRAVLGPDYTAALPDTVLTATRGSPHPTQLATLYRKRLVTVDELSSRQRFDEGQFKKLTGGDRIKTRRMHEDWWNFDPTHVFVLTGNRKPKVNDYSTGFWRRIKMVPFTETIPPEEQEKDLGRRLAEEEGPGILAWLVRGALEYAQHGLGEPKAVALATLAYRDDEDPLSAYIDDRLLTMPGTFVRVVDVFSDYKTWTEMHGIDRGDRLSSRAFKQELEARGFASDRQLLDDGSKPTVWTDITLRAAPSPVATV